MRTVTARRLRRYMPLVLHQEKELSIEQEAEAHHVENQRHSRNQVRHSCEKSRRERDVFHDVRHFLLTRLRPAAQAGLCLQDVFSTSSFLAQKLHARDASLSL